MDEMGGPDGGYEDMEGLQAEMVQPDDNQQVEAQQPVEEI